MDRQLKQTAFFGIDVTRLNFTQRRLRGCHYNAPGAKPHLTCEPGGFENGMCTVGRQGQPGCRPTGRRCVPLCAKLFSTLPSGPSPRPDDRQRNEPYRFPVGCQALTSGRSGHRDRIGIIPRIHAAVSSRTCRAIDLIRSSLPSDDRTQFGCRPNGVGTRWGVQEEGEIQWASNSATLILPSCFSSPLGR
jgi:hypothetical protein